MLMADSSGAPWSWPGIRSIPTCYVDSIEEIPERSWLSIVAKSELTYRTKQRIKPRFQGLFAHVYKATDAR